MPLEILELILKQCEDEALALFLPGISKLFKYITEDNGALWRDKCFYKYSNELDVIPKPSNKSWKQFYFSDRISVNLFPLHGFTIGRSTLEELSQVPNAIISTTDPKYVLINGTNFWCSRLTNRFNRMYLVCDYCDLPKAWEDCGLVWSKSWNEYKIFLKRWNGNYKVTTQPYYKYFMDRKWFTAKIMSIAKQEGDVLYKIELDFSAEGGTADTANALYSISLVGVNGQKEYEEQYHDQRIQE